MSMKNADNPYGSFKDDVSRLEAVKLRERRLLWVGLAVCVSTTLILLFSDQPAGIAAGLGVIAQALMR
jgi:hypothetical protein